MSGYQGGHILRIKLKNFLTYEDFELHPQHGLNLIIGLNGSGKSSIMCAICLGLAGNVKLTGRSGNLSDFIKYGCSRAVIEIELENLSQNNAIITRIIEKESSTWRLNNNLVSLAKIQKIVQGFNIDVSNLCQFLPQEKVKEFAMMDKKARLENMLQCIGDPYLCDTYKELKQLKTESSKLDEQIRLCQKNIEEENQKIEQLKTEVDKHEEKLRLIEHLKSFEQLKLYLDYSKTKEQLDTIKQEKKTLRKLHGELSDEICPLRDEINVRTQQLEEILEQLSEKNQKLDNIQKDILEKQQEMETCQDMVSNAKVLYENKIVEKNNQLAKIDMLCQQKQELELLYENSISERPLLEEQDKALCKSLEEMKNKLLLLEQNKACIALKLNQLQKSIKKTTAEIECAKKEEKKKMEFLKEKFEDAYKALLWLKNHKSELNAEVYGPMLFVLRPEKNQYYKLIENFVNENDLTAFFCEDKDDFKLLIQTLRVENDLKVNIVLVPDKSLEEYETPTISDELSEMGVEGFMSDCIKVPDAIMVFLCECYQLHLTPVCNSTEKNTIDLLLQKYNCVFTPDAKYVRKQSKYGDRNANTMLDHVWDKGILKFSGNYSSNLESLIEENQEDLEMAKEFNLKLNEIKAEIEKQEKEENMLREQKKTIQIKLKDFGNYERQLNRKKNLYETKQEELIDEIAEKEAVINKVQEMISAVLGNGQIIHQLTASLADFSATLEQKLKCYLKARLIEKKLVSLQKILDEKEGAHKQVEEQLMEIKENSKQLMQKGCNLMISLIRLVPEENQTEISPEFDVNSPADVRRKFQQIIPALKIMFRPYVGYDEPDIEKEIHHVNAQMEINSEDTTGAFNEYNKRTQRLFGMEKEVKTFQLRLNEIQNNMNTKRGKWLPDLEKHINDVNNKFSRYYAELGCAGEVSLDTCNNSDDFLNYGLQVNLKYRDSEPLAELSKARHSGGECSVAAIIFILSLQGLTQVPFRCIDEINQGMDDVNERIIYDLIALNIKQEVCPQYFLLTPHLLDNLEMIEHKDIKVHIIFNSAFLCMDLDVRKHIEIMNPVLN